MRPLLLLPEMLLFAGGLAALMSGSFLPRDRQGVSRAVAVTALVASLVATVVGMVGGVQSAFDGSFAVDTGTGVVRLLGGAATLFVLVLAADELAGTARESETYALLLFSTTGTLVVGGGRDLLVLAAGFLLASIPLYGLVGLVRTARGAEAAMKTYLLGALFGIALLLGITLLYAVAGSTLYTDLSARLGDAPFGALAAGLVGVLAVLLFEAGAVPAHFWVPDATEASSGTVAAFLTTVPKIGALVATYRLVQAIPDSIAWPVLVAVLAVASMTLGNLAAYGQQDPRRLLGWSTVSQVGYLLVPVAVADRTGLALPSMLLYLTAYTVTNLSAFAVTAALPGRRRLDDYRGLSRSRPWLAGSLLVSLLGLVGTPPTAVFLGKLTTATAAWDGGQAWLAVAVLVNTVASLFYYLRWIVPAFRAASDTAPASAKDGVGRTLSTRAAVTAAVLSVAVGVAGGAIWQALQTPLLS